MCQKDSQTIVIPFQSSLPKLSGSRQMAVKQVVIFAHSYDEKSRRFNDFKKR